MTWWFEKAWDPEVDALIRLIEADPDGWEFDQNVVRYGRDVDAAIGVIQLKTDGGPMCLQFYHAEEPRLTRPGQQRLWKALKQLRAVQIDRAREAIPPPSLEERCQEKVKRLEDHPPMSLRRQQRS